MTCLCRHRGEAGVQLQYISNPALELGGQHQKAAFYPSEKSWTRFICEDPDGTEPLAPPGLGPKIAQPVTSHYTDRTILAASSFCTRKCLLKFLSAESF
jgi:hypothetical protein